MEPPCPETGGHHSTRSSWGYRIGAGSGASLRALLVWLWGPPLRLMYSKPHNSPERWVRPTAHVSHPKATQNASRQSRRCSSVDRICKEERLCRKWGKIRTVRAGLLPPTALGEGGGGLSALEKHKGICKKLRTIPLPSPPPAPAPNRQ